MTQAEGLDWSRVGWLTLGLVLAAIFGYIVVQFLGTFVTGVFVYYALRPFHSRIERYVGRPNLAAMITVLVLTLPALALVGYAAAIAVQELYAFARDQDFGPVLDALEPYVDVSAAIENPRTLLDNPGSLEPILSSATAMLDYLGVVGTVLLHLFVVLALAFYLLRDDEPIARMGRVLTDRHAALGTYASAVDTSLQRIFFGNLLNAIITGGIGVVVYSAMNVFAPEAVQIPYPALIGVLTGVGSMIPVVGMKIVYVPIAGVLALNAALSGEGWWFVAVFAIVSAIVVDMIPDFLLRPYVSGRNLHVGAVMLAYVIGPILFGWYGIFLAPLLLVLMVQFYRIVLPELLAGKPITAAAVSAGTMRSENTGSETDSTPASDAAGDETGAATDDGEHAVSEGGSGEDDEGADDTGPSGES